MQCNNRWVTAVFKLIEIYILSNNVFVFCFNISKTLYSTNTAYFKRITENKIFFHSLKYWKLRKKVMSFFYRTLIPFVPSEYHSSDPNNENCSPCTWLDLMTKSFDLIIYMTKWFFVFSTFLSVKTDGTKTS